MQFVDTNAKQSEEAVMSYAMAIAQKNTAALVYLYGFKRADGILFDVGTTESNK